MQLANADRRRAVVILCGSARPIAGGTEHGCCEQQRRGEPQGGKHAASSHGRNEHQAALALGRLATGRINTPRRGQARVVPVIPSFLRRNDGTERYA